MIRLLQCCKHNAMSGLLTIVGVIMAFHYEHVLSLWGGCPIVVALGPPETGKSTAIVMGLALMGVDDFIQVCEWIDSILLGEVLYFYTTIWYR